MGGRTNRGPGVYKFSKHANSTKCVLSITTRLKKNYNYSKENLKY